MDGANSKMILLSRGIAVESKRCNFRKLSEMFRRRVCLCIRRWDIVVMRARIAREVHKDHSKRGKAQRVIICASAKAKKGTEEG